MAVELLEDTAVSLKYLPPRRVTSATCSFFKPSDGTNAVSSGAATVAGWSTTIQSVQSQTSFHVNSAANLNPGDVVWLESADSKGSPITISEVNGTTITLVEPPPGTMESEDSIYPLEISYSLTTTDTKDRGRNYSALWALTFADGGPVEKFRQCCHIVRCQFRDAMSPADAKRYITANFPSWSVGRDTGYFEQIATRASNKVKLMIQNTGDYPSLMGDPDAFTISAGLYALRLELALDGLFQGTDDLNEYIDQTHRGLTQAVAETIRGLMWVDRNDDNAVELDEVRKPFTVRATRQ